MLDACYSYYMMGSKWESVLVNAWNETKLIIKCPRCESEDLHEYAQPPYLGYPLVYEHICKESSEARRYQAIFPYVIHKLTTCKEEPVGTPDPGTIQPIGYQLHPSGKYWVTVGKGFRTAWWQLDPGTPRSRPQKEEEVESLSEKLGGLLLTNNNPKSDSPERSSPRSSKLEFDLVETIRSLSDANEKRIEKLYSFQQILEVYGEDGPSDPITWRIISSTSMRDEWICEKQTGCNKTLIRTTTKPNKGVRAASLARRGQPFNNLVTFSGAGPEPDLVSKTIFISLHSEISDFFDADRPERFPYPDLDLRDWAIELSEIVEMKYDGHEMLWWNTLDGIRNFECSHTEKKTIVWYLIVRGIRHPKEMEGTMLKAKHKQNHILRLYGSQAPCKWCIEFLEKVTKQFSKSGLCIGWRNIPEEEKAKRPGPSTQGEIERPNTAERGGKSSPSASMTYINVCGLGADITWPALPVVPTPGST
ncbi:hypothetical protein AOL_s00083g393 [Orbilia oligospora ATCC 24927]|uniref:Uncharacterized protein n=1 Tax=Arthrobotrys oligospora (strain ATCC 24927 / CBS 115.81 / DSM 1491) TaxID=756982 RepID=G1XHB2_ARTOA|nr:hypothetical protein AOL_s00083g393 [Orbilia oligospora ATCC 24927]EGX47457.1 hypothetical protein AOL_s00083g393 [Orbilia oligospora ATCC 24927]